MNKSIWAVILLVIGIGVNPYIIESHAEDIQGWWKLKWGMHENEVKMLIRDKEGYRSAEFEKEKDRTIDKYPFMVSNWVICDIGLNVYFLKDISSGGLNEVRLLYQEDNKLDKAKRLFDCLEAKLISKYGKITHIENENDSDSNSEEKTRIWRFNTTVIELQYSYINMARTRDYLINKLDILEADKIYPDIYSTFLFYRLNKKDDNL